MTDNLKITTPIGTNENINKVHPREISDTPVIDPARVGSRSRQQPFDQKQAGLDYQFNQQSVYNKFLHQFQTTSALSSTLKKIFFDAFLRQNTASVNQTHLDALLNTVAAKFQMKNNAEMSEQIQYLQNNNTKFSGDFFEMLRGILFEAKQYKDDTFSVLLGQFLKSYDNHMSAGDTLNAIIFTCRNLTLMMRRTAAEQMRQFTTRLESFSQSQEPLNAAGMLKQEVIPFLSKYIGSTNDLGRTRDMVTLIVHNLARLNTGSAENVKNHFSSLMDYCRYNLNLSNTQLKMIESLYEHSLSESSHKENEYFQGFIEVLKNGVKDNESAVSKTMYKDIANSLLLDQNTFMPLTHIFLPVNYNGTFMFSEIWIDKEQETSTEETQISKKIRLLLTFDIQNLGYFETVIQLSGKTAEINLNYPNSLKDKNKEIKEAIQSIFSNQGFSVKNINVTAGAAALKLDKVFPNIYERKQSVNVSI